jgi:hypothetical protein
VKEYLQTRINDLPSPLNLSEYGKGRLLALTEILAHLNEVPADGGTGVGRDLESEAILLNELGTALLGYGGSITTQDLEALSTLVAKGFTLEEGLSFVNGLKLAKADAPVYRTARHIEGLVSQEAADRYLNGNPYPPERYTEISEFDNDGERW